MVYLSIATLDYLLHTMFLHCSAIVAKCPAMAKAIYCMCSPPTHPPTPCYATATPLPSFRFTALQCNSTVPPTTTHRESLYCSYLSSPNCCYWYCFEWYCSYSSVWSGVLLCTMLHLLAVENFSVQLLWEGRPPAFQKGGNCCGRPTSLTSPFTLFHISAMSHHQLDSDSPKENDMVDWCFLCFVLQCLHT